MKNTCKVVLGLSAILTLGAMPGAVMANTIVLSQNSNYSYSDGGEFTAVTTGQSFTGNGYVASTLVGGGFQTFCIESTVYFSPGTVYNYSLSTTVDSVGQNLTQGAAYLYYQFATGNLTGYKYTAGGNRVTTAGQLQAAIWYLMGKQIVSGFGYDATTIINDPFYSLAVSQFGSAAAAAANYTGSSVEILELTDSNGAAQNQLVLTGTPAPHGTPMPDGGTTVLLLGSVLSGLALIKRKLTA